MLPYDIKTLLCNCYTIQNELMETLHFILLFTENVSLLDIPCVSAWEWMSVQWRLQQITLSDAIQHQLSNSECWEEQNLCHRLHCPLAFKLNPVPVYNTAHNPLAVVIMQYKFEFSLKWVGHSTHCLHKWWMKAHCVFVWNRWQFQFWYDIFPSYKLCIC